MKNLIDVHNHTVASGHAYNSYGEMCEAAAAKGIQYYAITEHAPTMPGTCEAMYFTNFHVIDRNAYGLNLMNGAEVNIINTDGDLDLTPRILAMQDIIIVSLHSPTFNGNRDLESCTSAVINAMRNPYTHILGHPDDGQFPLDYDAVIRVAAEEGIIIEMNDASFSPWSYRKNCRENARIYLERCFHYNVPVILNSDAHFCSKTGCIDFAKEVIEENDFPESLILNDKPEQFMDMINKRRRSWGGEPIIF
ncbi:MAG TPA: phosphatase [Clostridiaceae bacterium]|nr:phosphatase [Clostridiaceae bacterium]